MILTCPDCATSYFVDETKIPPDGRMVKCTACGKRWTASCDPPELELVEDESEGAYAREAGAGEITFEAAPLSELPAEAIPRAIRAKSEMTRRMREAAAVGVVWAGLAAVLVGAIGAAVVFRMDVVRLWPKSAAAYASVGMPVNQLGLTIEDLTVETALKDGQAAYSVTGSIRNVKDRLVTSPPLKLTLHAKDGRPLVTKVARPADPRIPPGEARHFGLVILDPPSTASELEVRFATELAGEPLPAGKAEPDAKAAKALALRRNLDPAPAPPALIPVEAEPLPPGTPHALPAHE